MDKETFLVGKVFPIVCIVLVFLGLAVLMQGCDKIACRIAPCEATACDCEFEACYGECTDGADCGC